jgi:hypothetical protein
MISRLRIDNDGVAYYDIWKNIPATRLRSGDIIEYLLEDLAVHSITLDDISSYPWIIDLQWEGHNANDIESFVQLLRTHGVTRIGAVFTSYQETKNLPYHAVCSPDRMIYNGNWFMHLESQQIDWQNMPMTHKLIVLMRRPSLSRCHIAKRLFRIFDPEHLIISLGTHEGYVSEELKQIILPHPWPLIVDATIADQVTQHKVQHTKFYTAPVQLIPESSSQIDPGVWTSQFITEKTYKALSWYQFPIWYAVPGLVSRIRDMGFDVFDDVWEDHTYDKIEDPWVRMVQVLIQIQRVCKLDTIQMRVDMWERLKNNAVLVKTIHNNVYNKHNQLLEKLKNEI